MDFTDAGRTRTIKGLLVALLAGVVLTSLLRPVVAQTAAHNPGGQAATKHRTGTTSAAAKVEVWRSMMMKPRAKQPGCYQALYPAKQWSSVPCKTAPGDANGRLPMIPRPIIKSQDDYIAQSASGAVKSATGTIVQILRNTSATGFGGTANEFSFQLNPNTFPTTSYGCDKQPGCQGWIQFYVDSGGSMQFAILLLDYLNAQNPNCPDGYKLAPAPGCYRYYSVMTFPNNEVLPFASFAGLILTGEADSVNDTFTLSLPNGTLLQAVVSDSVIQFAGKWSATEFNVFGNSGGDTTIFNPGTYIFAKLTQDDGTQIAPTCLSGQYTSENTNLVEGTCGSFGSPSPGIQFEEDVPPQVTSISPPGGPAAGGTVITVLGQGFTNNMEAGFGTYYTGVGPCTPTQCTVTSPPGQGPVHFTLGNLGVAGAPLGFSNETPPVMFTYQVTPSSGVMAPFSGLPPVEPLSALAEMGCRYRFPQRQ